MPKKRKGFRIEKDSLEKFTFLILLYMEHKPKEQSIISPSAVSKWIFLLPILLSTHWVLLKMLLLELIINHLVFYLLKRPTLYQKLQKRFGRAKHKDQFPIDVFQTGSGTSSNMNANEVIANLASKFAKTKLIQMTM